MGPVLRPIFDAVVAELRSEGGLARSELRTRVLAATGANPKTVDSLLCSMADFGLVRLAGLPNRTVRLTTLGERWLDAEGSGG